MSQGDKASGSPASASSDADLAQAFRELARGEQQAAAMEANLSKLESKLDDLLAQFEAAAEGSAALHEVNNTNKDGQSAKDEKQS